MRRCRLSFATLACVTMLAAWWPIAPAAASGFADLGEIDRAVAGFTGAGAGAVGGAAYPVDRRLRLASCAMPLALSWRGERRDSVLVQCPDAGGWRIFVAVPAAAATAGNGAVARGEEVTVAVTGDGFTVSQSGEALEAGAVGDWIRVSPDKPGKGASEPIRAQVIRPGLVAVLLP